MRSATLSLLIVLMLAATAMAGSKSTIVGMVTDNVGVPLAGVELTIIGEATYTNRVTTTDDKGVYFFTNLPADEYIIQAIAKPTGVYKPGSKNIFLESHTEEEVLFRLEKR